MTKVSIDSGTCGYGTTVEVEKAGDKTISIKIVTECGMVEKMAEEIQSIKEMALFSSFSANPVYRAASKHLSHVTCPVPSGILKAAEVEAGFNVAKDVHIIFIK